MADSRLQVDLDQDTLGLLDRLMVDARRSEGTRKIGAGTIAARLLETLSAHPDMIEKLLGEYSQRVGGMLVAAESKVEYQTSPKARSGPQAKKQAAR